MRDIRVTGEIGDRRMLGRQIGPVGQMHVHERQQPIRDRDGLVAIAGQAPDCDQAGRGRTIGYLARCDRQPALDMSRRDRVNRQPSPRAVIAPREIDQNRVAVGEHDRAILQDRDLAKRIECQEFAGPPDIGR